jgi:hypothetical protein
MTIKKSFDKHPGGAPSLYKPEYCEQAREMFKQGFSKVEIAAAFDVNRDTLDNWAAQHPEFFRTINKDIDFSEATWTKWGRENLANKDFNSRLYEINMMNRFGWMKKAAEKHDVTVKMHEEILKELE